MNPIDPGLATPPPTTSSTPETPIRKRRGCFFYACLITLLFTLVVMAVIGMFGRRLLTWQVQRYTSETAVPLPEVEYSDDDLSKLEQRLERVSADTPVATDARDPASQELLFSGEVPSDSNAPPGPGDLVLSARDINALIGRNPELRGKVFVTIEDGTFSGEVSIPMPSVHGGEGRFFNASAIFSVELRDAELFVTVTDADVKGKRVPKILLDAVAGENLAQEINQHPRMKPRLEQFENLSIVADKLILRAKTDTTTVETSDDPTTNPSPSSID